jgi:hypothetical protein
MHLHFQRYILAREGLVRSGLGLVEPFFKIVNLELQAPDLLVQLVDRL